MLEPTHRCMDASCKIEMDFHSYSSGKAYMLLELLFIICDMFDFVRGAPPPVYRKGQFRLVIEWIFFWIYENQNT